MRTIALVSGAFLAVCFANFGCGETDDDFPPGVTYEGEWGEEGHGPGEFTTVHDMAVAPNGNVYTVDPSTQMVNYFTAEGVYVGSWSFHSGDAIAVSPNTNVYVVNSIDYYIRYYTKTGEYLGHWTPRGDGFISGISVAPDTKVYIAVASYSGNCVQYYSRTGSFRGEWHTSYYPSALEVSDDGTVYVLGTDEYVRCYTANGSFLRRWRAGGHSASDITVGSDGKIFVVDCDECRIRYYDAEGTELGSWGWEGPGPGGFNLPDRLSAAPLSRVYVNDHYNRRIQYFHVE